MAFERMRIFTGNANPKLAEAVCKHLNISLGRAVVGRFSDGEVMIELLESVEPDDEVVRACERLVSQGYALALDDFVNRPAYEPLLQLASVVKIDVLGKSEAELKQRCEEMVAAFEREGMRALQTLSGIDVVV